MTADSRAPRRTGQPAGGMLGRSITRRGLFGVGALLGLAALTVPTQDAYAWSSWTNWTSPMLKSTGMGDCVHEDLVQISYARMIRNHANDATKPDGLLNPWAGVIQADARYATIAGDTVDRGSGKTFSNAGDLATRLFRENLAYLRIGSFWNDAAANTFVDFGYSCVNANAIPKFSGADRYEGAWDVGQHIWETNEQNKKSLVNAADALVQFTMNDRNNFIHGMLFSTASHKEHFTQAEVKRFALQWLGVAYEYARTGKVTTTKDVTAQEQAEWIFKGFIDTYGQLDESTHDMVVSLKVSNSEASRKISHRRLRLRALGMMCHTLEDFWCPAHTCRTYHEKHEEGQVQKNAILAFSNYKLQNGNKSPMNGYHIPFDRYAVSDSKNSTDWRRALTRGDKTHKGTEQLDNVLDSSMKECLENAHTYFNTLGMNETIDCITQLFEFMYQGTAWDEGVREWVDRDIMPTYFREKDGQSYICDAGRRSLHTPTFIYAPIKSMRQAYKKVGIKDKCDAMLVAATQYDLWQRGTHKFFSGEYNTGKSKYVTPGHEGDKVWADSEGESRLIALADAICAGYTSLDANKQKEFLTRLGPNGCHDMITVLARISGMLQEFNIDLQGSLRASTDPTMQELEAARTFFASGLKDQGLKAAAPAAAALEAFAIREAFADEDEDSYITSDMAIEDTATLEDGSYAIAVRDLDSLETSVMRVPADAPGVDKLKEGLANLSITYTLDEEFDDDLDYRYVVTSIDYSDMEEDVYLITGTVKTLAEDKKSLVLDLNGLGVLALSVRDGVTEVPEVGDYVCARYSFGASDLELVGYDELEAPGKLKQATYPAEVVAGTSVLLITNPNEDGSDGGYPEYLQIDYGCADVRSVPIEGNLVTVYYHDEAYGEEAGLTAADMAPAHTAGEGLVATSEEVLYAQDDDEGLTDSPAEARYADEKTAEEYSELDYGDDVIHVADVIVGHNDNPYEPPSKPGTVTPVEPEPVTPSPATPDNNNPNPDGNATPPASNPNPAPTPAPSTTPSTTPSATTTPATGSARMATTSATPSTGDRTGALGGLLSAAALAGAAMAAYSARRVALEHERSEEE